MAKYIRKTLKDFHEITPEVLKQHTFHAKQVKEDTVLDTIYGDVLVTTGNYVLTDCYGAQVGITPIDLELQYEKG